MGLELDESVAASDNGLKNENERNAINSISSFTSSGSRGAVLQDESRQVGQKVPVLFLRGTEGPASSTRHLGF